LYATKAGWYSYEDKDGRNGVFTRFLLQGLGGEADGSGPTSKRDGSVSFAELAAWLPDAMGSYALDQGIRQKAVVLKGTGDSAALDMPATKPTGIPVAADPSGAAEKKPMGQAATVQSAAGASTQLALLSAAEIGKLSQGQRLKQAKDYIAKALSYAGQGKAKEVLAALNTAELLDPDIKDDPSTAIDVANKLGDSFESMMNNRTIDPADLLDVISMVLPRFPQSSRLYYCIGRLYNPESLNKPKKALEYYNKAIELDPANVMAHNNRAYIFYSAGQDLEQAMKDIYFPIKAFADDVYCRNMGAKIALKLGDYSQALDIAQSGLRVYDQYRSRYDSDRYIQADLLVGASRALVQLGRIEEAKTLLAKAKALGSQEAVNMQLEIPALR
jgi:tetratricopeptide (TPR) repeat protein